MIIYSIRPRCVSVFDPSLIFHALTADEETNLGDDVDKVYEYTKDAAPRTNSKSAKNKKKHKKKHKKRHDKGGCIMPLGAMRYSTFYIVVDLYLSLKYIFVY